METKTCDTYWAKIYIAGPIEGIEQCCREYVLKGLCVTVTPTKYIYSGGEEAGAEIGLINYPRFPATANTIINEAIALGEKILMDLCQGSYTVMTPDSTTFYSRRDSLGK